MDDSINSTSREGKIAEVIINMLCVAPSRVTPDICHNTKVPLAAPVVQLIAIYGVNHPNMAVVSRALDALMLLFRDTPRLVSGVPTHALDVLANLLVTAYETFGYKIAALFNQMCTTFGDSHISHPTYSAMDIDHRDGIDDTTAEMSHQPQQQHHQQHHHDQLQQQTVGIMLLRPSIICAIHHLGTVARSRQVSDLH